MDSQSNKVVEKMYNADPFSQWLGIERISEFPGHCILHMTVREEMCNGFGLAHGGITYSLADSALAFASNSHGRKCLSIETSISHALPVKKGDQLTAEAEERHCSNKIGIYDVVIINQEGKKVAFFKGTVYRTSKDWEV